MTPKRNGFKFVQTQSGIFFGWPMNFELQSQMDPYGVAWTFWIKRLNEKYIAKLRLQPFWWGNTVFETIISCSSKTKLGKCNQPKCEIKSRGIFCESASIWHKAVTLDLKPMNLKSISNTTQLFLWNNIPPSKLPTLQSISPYQIFPSPLINSYTTLP